MPSRRGKNMLTFKSRKKNIKNCLSLATRNVKNQTAGRVLL